MKNNKRGIMIIIYGMLVMFTVNYVFYNAKALFIIPMTEDLGISRSALAVTGTLASLAGILVSPLIGKLLSKEGTDIKRMMALGMLGFGALTALQAAAKSMMMLYVLNFIMGILLILIYIMPLSILASRWLPGSSATAIGLMFVGVSLAGFILSAPMTSLIENVGWRNTYLICGAVILLVDFPACLLLVKNAPSEEEKAAILAANPVAAAEAKAEMADSEEKPLLKDKRFWILMLGLCSVSVCNQILYHISAFVQSLGYTAMFAAGIISAYSVVSMGSKLMMGRLFDKKGILAGSLFGTVGLVTYFVFGILAILTGNSLFVYSIAVTFGIGLACSSVLSPAMMRGVFGNRRFGEVQGQMAIFTGISNAFGNQLLSMLYDATGNYMLTNVVCLCLALVGIACFVVLAADKKRRTAF